MSNKEDLNEEIAKVAYILWEKSGKIPGKDLENWLEAEKIVIDLHKNKNEDDQKNKDGQKSQGKMMNKEMGNRSMGHGGKMGKMGGGMKGNC